MTMLEFIALVVAIVSVVVAVCMNASRYDSKEEEAYEEWKRKNGEKY